MDKSCCQVNPTYWITLKDIRGRVRVSSSSTAKGNVISILDRTPTEFWTLDVPSSCKSLLPSFYRPAFKGVQVSLGSSRTLVPHYYTIRHGGTYLSINCDPSGNSKADALRNWTLQGSNDGKNWVLLRRHVNETALNSNFATASFEIPSCSQSFRHFRILQTGHNSSGNNFLSISGFELYGFLYEEKKDGYASP